MAAAPTLGGTVVGACGRWRRSRAHRRRKLLYVNDFRQLPIDSDWAEC